MLLHENKELFIKIISAAAVKLNIRPALIEKDYFVTLFLKKAKERIEGLVFKGGTSLTKCHKLSNRFSEDIDLTLDIDHFTIGKRKNAVYTIIDICEELNLTLTNKEDILSHRSFSQYKIDYPKNFDTVGIEQKLIVELAMQEKGYPTLIKEATSYIYVFLKNEENIDVDLEEYDLKPFNIQVLSLERTLIDKVFAVIDYYLKGVTRRNSRHIYDIYKALKIIDINTNEFKELVKVVREERKKNKTCLSAQDEVDVNKLLKEIIDSSFYKDDFNNVTYNLLNEDIDYETVISGLKEVINSNAFNK